MQKERMIDVAEKETAKTQLEEKKTEGTKEPVKKEEKEPTRKFKWPFSLKPVETDPEEMEYTKSQLLNNDSHGMSVDLLYAILEDGKKYKLKDVRKLYEKALNREV